MGVVSFWKLAHDVRRNSCKLCSFVVLHARRLSDVQLGSDMHTKAQASSVVSRSGQNVIYEAKIIFDN